MNKWYWTMMLQRQSRFWEKNLIIILFVHLETIWRDWSVNMVLEFEIFPAIPVSSAISIILFEKNYCKQMGKQRTCIVGAYSLRFILRSFLWIRDIAQSEGFAALLVLHTWYLTEDSQAHEMNKKGASKGTSLWRTFKNLREVWEWQNYQNKAIKSTKISKTIRTVRTFRTLWTSNFF